jgi:hypothetical protein
VQQTIMVDLTQAGPQSACGVGKSRWRTLLQDAVRRTCGWRHDRPGGARPSCAGRRSSSQAPGHRSARRPWDKETRPCSPILPQLAKGSAPTFTLPGVSRPVLH